MEKLDVLLAFALNQPLYHKNRPYSVYTIEQVVKLDVGGVWAEGAIYSSGYGPTKKTYCRPIYEFNNFSTDRQELAPHWHELQQLEMAEMVMG